jgi:hypothetical protein
MQVPRVLYPQMIHLLLSLELDRHTVDTVPAEQSMAGQQSVLHVHLAEALEVHSMIMTTVQVHCSDCSSGCGHMQHTSEIQHQP